MTVSLSGWEVAQKITKQFPDAVSEASGSTILIKSDHLFDVIKSLKDNLEFDFSFLNYVTAVDYCDYFEVVYQLTSLTHNHTLVLKTRCDRNDPAVPSIVSLYKGADFQEREVYDLMGINFTGHPNMKRIVLWPGFEGHPLRKDYL